MTTVNLTAPESWAELSLKQLLFVAKTRALALTREEFLFLYFCKLTGLKCRSKIKDTNFVFKHNGIRFALDAETLRFFCNKLVFLLDESPTGVIAPIPVDSHMIGVPFEDYYSADALLINYQTTQKKKFLKKAVRKLTNKRLRISRTKAVVILIWWASLKNYLKEKYPHVYSDGDEESEYAPLETLHEMLLLLNDSKPQENNEILKTDTHFVLSALNARIERAKKMAKK